MDVTYFQESSGGLGFILREPEGHFLMSASKWLSNPLEEEAMAMIFGLQVLSEVSFPTLKAETDNLHLALLLQCHYFPLNCLGLLVDDILTLSRFF